jgi:hypothetical protein
MKARLEDILVEFECAECNLTVEIPVIEIIEVGTPLCTICEANPEMYYGDAVIEKWEQ